MIPRIWRYLFTEQLKMAALSLVGTMLLLVLLRMEEIARFAALGAPIADVLHFASIIVAQMTILAIPLAVFLASYITWQRFSQSCELLGALTSGIRLEWLMAPSFSLALMMGALSGWLALDTCPKAQLDGKALKNYWSSVNPTHLLRSETIWKLPGATVISRQNETQLGVFIVSHHGKQRSSQLIYLDQLQLGEHSNLTVGPSTHLILYPPDHNQYMNLENVASGTYSHFLGESEQRTILPPIDQLPLKALWDRINHPDQLSSSQIRKLRLEPYRRLFFSVLPLALASLGMVSGFQLDRRSQGVRQTKTILWILGMLIAYFAAKGIGLTLTIGCSIYLGLPLLCTFFSIRRLKRLAGCL